MGIGITGLLGVTFIALKLAKVIAWRWVWVLAPFWIGAAFLGVLALIALTVAGIRMILERSRP